MINVALVHVLYSQNREHINSPATRGTYPVGLAASRVFPKPWACDSCWAPANRCMGCRTCCGFPVRSALILVWKDTLPVAPLRNPYGHFAQVLGMLPFRGEEIWLGHMGLSSLLFMNTFFFFLWQLLSNPLW